jgi:excisionase family DNA binding protein
MKINGLPEGVQADLTIDQVAAIRQVHPKTVRRWIANGELKAYRIGKRSVRIKPTDLERQGRRIGGAA